MTILAIGNGESRAAVNLKKIKYKTIGCNAIYRDHLVDYLVCVDRRMVVEALQHGYKNKIFTRQNWMSQFSEYKHIVPVPSIPNLKIKNKADDPFNWGSGPYAILLSALSDYTIIMIGFDLYGNGKLINNFYKGSNNYDPATHHAIDPRYWIYQINKIFKTFCNHSFIIYQDTDWNLPPQWQLPNVSVDKITNFKYTN